MLKAYFMLLQINVSTKGKVCATVYVDNTIETVKITLELEC